LLSINDTPPKSLCGGGMQSTECFLVTIIIKQHTVMMSQKMLQGHFTRSWKVMSRWLKHRTEWRQWLTQLELYKVSQTTCGHRILTKSYCSWGFSFWKFNVTLDNYCGCPLGTLVNTTPGNCDVIPPK